MPGKNPAIRYSHDNLIDVIIAHPRIQQNELAAMFGYSAAWISTIMCSDAFKAKLEQSREELVDPEIRLRLEERFRAITTRSLQVLQEKLSQPQSQISDQLAIKAAELGAKCLGFGQPQPTVIAPPEDHLERIADRLIALQRGLGHSTPITIDGQAETVAA